MLKGVSTITDIHNNSENTEVELVSLLTEQIPKYKLRVNSAVGYDKCDWLQTPVLPTDANVDLSPELCAETFKFFLLGGDRLSQMTRTYHDIEAVTQLLEEKERDLELAARIGQSLLEKNREAAQRQEFLEEELARVVEEASQLRHEISLKEDLLHIYADDDTDSSAAPSPVKELKGIGRSAMYSHVECLQKKITELEKNNHFLKQEHEELQAQTEDIETEEQQLVSDTVRELSKLHEELRESHKQITFLSEELQIKAEDAARQQEEITRLLSQIVDMQRKHKVLALENEELQQHLSAANNSQYELTKEVRSLEDKYEEVLMMLDETREEARGLRDNTNVPVTFGDSLAAELEMSDFSQFTARSTNVTQNFTNEILHAEGNVESNKSATFNKPYDRIFDMAKYANTATNGIASMNSFQACYTPNKQDRPIATARQSIILNRDSPDSTPSSGRNRKSDLTPKLNKNWSIHTADSRFSSTPHRENDSSYNPNIAPSPISATPTGNIHKNTRTLQMQLASRALRLHNKSNRRSSSSSSSSHSSFDISCIKQLAHSETPPLSPKNTPSFNLSMESIRANCCTKCSSMMQEDLHEDVFLQRNACLATPSLGRPGVPGTDDLERAIRKLAMRREGARYMEENQYQNRGLNSYGSDGDATTISSPGTTPPPSRPPSPMLNESRGGKYSRFARRSGPFPKLRIIKPLEGSVTLNQWKSLAMTNHLLSSIDNPSSIPKGVLQRGSGTSKSLNHIERKESTAFNFSLKEKSVQTTSHSPVLFNTACSQSQDLNPGKIFASTFSQYTYTNCKINNPKTEITSTIPSCSCASSQLVSSTSIGSKFDDIKKAEKEAAQNFFKENTRTCSTSLSLAHLFKEYGVKSNDADAEDELGENKPLPDSDKKEINFESLSEKTFGTKKKYSKHMIWSRQLERTFLLPSIPAQNELNLNRRSDKENPDTPPNSPTTECSPTFPLSKIISKPAKVQLESIKKESKNFSPNLLSKLKMLGLANVTIPPNTKDSKLTRCATMPGALNQSWNDHLLNQTVHAPPKERSIEVSNENLSTACPEISAIHSTSMDLFTNVPDKSSLPTRPLNLDWSELHGSSKENLNDENKINIPYQRGTTSTTNSLSQGSVFDLDSENGLPKPLNTSTPESNEITPVTEKSKKPKIKPGNGGVLLKSTKKSSRKSKNVEETPQSNSKMIRRRKL